MMTSSTAREKMLEKKINTLEHRMMLMERFVEMRFCETFRDFSARNSSASSSSILERVDTKDSRKIVNPTPISKPSHKGDDDHFYRTPALAPSPPPPSSEVSESEEEEPQPTTSYRTRSGRQTKRLSAAALSGVTPKKPLKSSPSKIKEISISNKVLRVNVSRLKGNKTEPPVDLDIVKVSVDTEEENDDAGDDDDYFTYPENQVEGQISGDYVEQDEDGDEYTGGEFGLDDDVNSSEGDSGEEVDFKAKGLGSRKRKKPSQVSGKGATGEKKKRIRYKYYVPSSLKLIAKGVSLENINPNTKTKECPFCHEHWRVDLFERHLENQHMKERHLQCAFCDKRFFVANALNLHQRTHQLDKYGTKCRLCEKVFSLPCKTLAHERICIRQRLESNEPVDHEIMEDVRQRSKHSDLRWPDPNEVIPEGMKRCTHCRVLVKEAEMQAHLKAKHLNWKCTLCNKTYVEKSGLVRHLCNAHGDNKKTCGLCKQVFESKSAIRAHNSECQRLHRRQSGKSVGRKSEDLIKCIQAKQQGRGVTVKEDIAIESETSSSFVVETEPEVGDVEQQQTQQTEPEVSDVEQQQTQKTSHFILVEPEPKGSDQTLVEQQETQGVVEENEQDSNVTA